VLASTGFPWLLFWSRWSQKTRHFERQKNNKPHAMNVLRLTERTEKAGVGGSTPSLAAISLNGLENPPRISHL
jgi:hypothetical protein